MVTLFIKISTSRRSRLGVGIKFRSSVNFYTPQNCKCVPGVSWTAATQRAVKVALIASQKIYRESSVFRSFGPRVSSILSSRDSTANFMSRNRGGLERSILPRGWRDIPSLIYNRFPHPWKYTDCSIICTFVEFIFFK